MAAQSRSPVLRGDHCARAISSTLVNVREARALDALGHRKPARSPGRAQAQQ
jgi:hypothetical protein